MSFEKEHSLHIEIRTSIVFNQCLGSSENLRFEHPRLCFKGYDPSLAATLLIFFTGELPVQTSTWAQAEDNFSKACSRSA